MASSFHSHRNRRLSPPPPPPAELAGAGHRNSPATFPVAPRTSFATPPPSAPLDLLCHPHPVGPPCTPPHPHEIPPRNSLPGQRSSTSPLHPKRRPHLHLPPPPPSHFAGAALPTSSEPPPSPEQPLLVSVTGAQCHIYPKVQQVVKQQKDPMKETLKKKILEEPVMNENMQDPDEQGLTRFFSNACYSCGEEGHYSQDCTKGSQEYLGNFPTEKVEIDPLDIEELARMQQSKKKRKYPRKSQISADKDLSHIRCFKCMEFGHYKYMCSGRNPETQGAKSSIKKPRDLSELICFRCKEAGHYANDCPHGKEARME
ncbi:hypothetical protein D1007_54151 [Hordeum vulgare]|nr:hypothetical protein D1007_54151 [Hordeum vulgare]